MLYLQHFILSNNHPLYIELMFCIVTNRYKKRTQDFSHVLTSIWLYLPLPSIRPCFILVSVWILSHKDKFCYRAVICFNVSKQPIDYIFLYKFTKLFCWSFIILKVFLQFLNCLFKLFMFFVMFFILWITSIFLKLFLFFEMKVSIFCLLYTSPSPRDTR